ncbi:MAG: flippase-like domain-containing protein, partial [Deltaproteobacteria bacterium]|nr:flippase-like domain-containing protein [Deltaproteobacteria bacterium]
MGPVIFILLFMRVVDTKATLNILKEIRPDMALVSILLFPIANAALTIRWWLICRRLEMEVSLNWLFQITYISWFLSALPLLGISPLSKLLYLKSERKPVSQSVVSIACDKLFDVLGLMVFGLFGLVYFPRGLFKGAYVWIVLATVVLSILILLLFGRSIWSVTRQFFKRYTGKRLQKIGSNLEEDLKGFWSGFNVRFFI